MKIYNFTMVQGDTFIFGININGLESDLSSAYFSVKKNYTDESYTLQKSLNNGIAKNEDGSYNIKVNPIDTENVEAGKYLYDVQIGIENDVFTILKGTLNIEQGVTEMWES